jgi:hypothetical protein
MVESIVARKEKCSKKLKKKTSPKKLHASMTSVGIAPVIAYVMANVVTPYRQESMTAAPSK